jgi:MFS family permease
MASSIEQEKAKFLSEAAQPNAYRLLWAGFFAIFASGVGFAVRGGILLDWARDYGFTMTELGGITGGGLWGFGLIIIFFSLIADKIGYGRLMVFAFAMHVLSAALTLCTPQIYASLGRAWTLQSLTLAMVLFAVGNGTCEAVVNPMVATLFPRNKTHYLNILHAGWPGGLIVGGLIAYLMNGGSLLGWVPFGKVNWMIQMSLFLVPTTLYGILLLGQRLPRSEASEAGLSYGVMLAQFLSPILIVLLLCHALVGYVELGTDSWISKITGSIMASPSNGLLLFVYTSGLMFLLRFFAGPIEHRLSPLGLLFCSAILGVIGLTLLSKAGSSFSLPGAYGAIIACVVAATVYALGKTFLWPTMLAVASERFPKGGAIVIGAMGGVGMLSAGFLGGPGIGFKQDYYASHQLKQESSATYERYAAEDENTFLGIAKVKGLDGTKVGILEQDHQIADLDKEIAETTNPAKKAELKLAKEEIAKDENAKLETPKLKAWWEGAAPEAKQDYPRIEEASLFGGRMALRLTAAVPATMAVLYLLLILYFRLQGGYKKVEI